MRLHHLEIQAFGPFADRQTVDFDALSGQGLFLLNGPTGAGKSSVLDAVCFALYGSVPGARHTAKRLRSDHAADGVVPEVCLEFSAGGRRYRIVRSPAWDRPARRGGGTTPEQARTLLSERIGLEWVQKSARNDEAGLELQALLGMDKDQFTKVVMLPQGEFAAFLRADTRARRELLQKLFSTTLFEAVESHLVEQGQRAARAVSEQEAHQGNLLLRAVEEAERHDLGAAGLGIDPEATADRVGSVRILATALRERREAAEAESTERAEASALADGGLVDLRRRRERAEAVRRLRKQQAEHDATGGEAGGWVEVLRRHEEARELSTVLHLDEQAQAAAAAATSRHLRGVERLRRNVAASHFIEGDAFSSDEGARAVLAQASSDASAAATMVHAALPDETHLLTVRSSLDAASVRLGSIETQISRSDAEILELEATRRAEMGELETARRAADGVDHLRSDLEAARGAQEIVVLHQDAETRRIAADAAHHTASQRFLDLKEQWLTKLQRRLEQAAVELAEGLRPGEPCAVCGSPDHPAPATSPGGDRITLEEEQAARKDQAEAERALHAAQDVRDTTRLEVADLAARGGDMTPAEAAGRTRAVQRSLEAAEAAAARGLALEHSLEKIERDVDRLRALRDELRDEHVAVSARRTSQLDQEAALVARLADLQADAPSLSVRLEAVRSASADLDAVRDAFDAHLLTSAAADAAGRKLQDALGTTGFPTAEAARDALLAEDERERVSGLLKTYEAEGHRLTSAWADDSVLESLREEEDGVPAPDDDDERDAAATANALRAQAQKALIAVEVLGQSVVQLEGYAQRLEDLEKVVAPLREPARTVSGLAETARGGGENLYKMPLATYVLASRLEQVAAAATERLLQMSDGRYALVHSDATAGNKRSGLGLNVVDGWTGNRRDTSTLSGGESFMASLALALGLADVVQQEAGGLDIETLFVDEGFGSLDDQALEQVMDALEGLRSGGRVVGLVSHVPELKQRVGAQLQVVKGRQGSTLHFVEQPVSV